MKYPGTLERGARGNGVKQVQRRLLELGYRTLGPGRELTADGDFGAITQEAVSEFQMQNRDRKGNPLVVDGRVGPLTWEALFEEAEVQLGRPEPKRDRGSQLMAAALEIARGEVGVLEEPKDSNRGPKVEQYLASVGLGPGNPWCAGFAYWCIQKASEAQGRREVPFLRTGYTPDIWNWAKGRGAFLLPEDVLAARKRIEPGSLFLLHGPVDGVERVKHVGFVAGVAGGMAQTVEGNTNKGGGREGGGVYQLERKISSIFRFVMYG